jgi:transcriptional regulator with XRE-family HTH domain
MQGYCTLASQKCRSFGKIFRARQSGMSNQRELSDFGRRMEAVRIVCTLLNQEQFAAAIGASKGQYNNWKHGSPMPLPYMTAIALQFGVTLDWLYLGDPSGLPFALKPKLEQAVRDFEKSKPPRRISAG